MSDVAAANIGEPVDRFASLLEQTGDSMAQDGADYDNPHKEAPQEAADDEEEDTAPEEASGEEAESDGEPEQEAESEDPDSDQEEEEDGEPEEAIAPPPSWSAADKETFKELPVAAQRAIAQREAARERFVNEKAQEAAQARKDAEAARQAVEQDRQGKLGQLDSALTALATELQGEFASVNWQELAATDPAEYVAKKAKYDAKMETFQKAQQTRQQEAQKAQEQQRTQFAQFVQEQSQKLLEAIPEWADPEVAKVGKAELRAAAREYGFSDDELQNLYDHRTVLALKDAAAYRKLQRSKAKVEKKVVAKPKVQKPGNQNTTKGDARSKRIADKRNQLRKSGKPEVAASVFAEFIDD